MIDTAPLIKGFGVCMGLIMAIGVQNAFVLRQGIRRRHVFTTALLCSLIDIVMITLGVVGVGTFIHENTLFMRIAKWGGMAFLFYYGTRSFYSAMQTQQLDIEADTPKPTSTWMVVLTILGISLLNPHLYLDTMVLIGSIGGQYEHTARTSYILGAILASVVWFFSLAYGSALLTPFFSKPKAWRILDVSVGTIMWGIAISLFWM